MKKMVYFFGGGKADGNGEMKNLLGGKGANLAEMAGHKELKLPVPPGFTITTEVCTHFYKNGKKYPQGVVKEVNAAMEKIEKLMGRKFGNASDPLLVSVRSGARSSMPGMMETVLNVGLTEKTVDGLIKQANGDERFVYDAYRRLIMMYSDVVMEKAAGIEPEEEAGIRKQLENIMNALKKKKGYTTDADLKAEDLKKLCAEFKKRVKKVIGKDFPEDPKEQLWGAIGAVFSSWIGKRAVSYRRIEGIPDEWGTAVNVQTMVFGNLGNGSATGVAFTRNPGNGENNFYGEFLINAQGEDVVAGTRTPAPINEASRSENNKELRSLEQEMPGIYKELHGYQRRLEKHYRDMQDIEFTIENGVLYMLQTRVGKRNGLAAVTIAVDMVKEKLIKKEEAVMRVKPPQLDELLHPIIDPDAEKAQTPVAKGLPAGPGGASGQVVFSSSDSVKWAGSGKEVILVREETNPEDVEGMRAANAILTARGGMTSHAALVARGWGKCCIVGCGALEIDHSKKTISIEGKTIKEGAWLTLNGTTGRVYEGRLPMIDAAEDNKVLDDFLKMCNSIKKLGVRANADTPADAKKAKKFGAEGIGLFRTEHMFYGEGSDKPLFLLRKMIMSNGEQERRKVLGDLSVFVKNDIKSTLLEMDNKPVVIRLIDPPLHEFVPREKSELEKLAKDLKIKMPELLRRADALRESNPMMGHRGVRLGVTYPEITEMQIRAIFTAAAELKKQGKRPYPEIMVPVVCDEKELENQLEIKKTIYKEVCKKHNLKSLRHMYGTMIEIPRACFLADRIAGQAEFFSFGTNDLTQMGFGFSRDDIGGFMAAYVEKGILKDDPFLTIDTEGIGELVRMAIEKGRKANKKLEIGICGEHGGDADSVEFCHSLGMDYVSCSPFRVPIASLAGAQAELRSKKR